VQFRPKDKKMIDLLESSNNLLLIVSESDDNGACVLVFIAKILVSVTGIDASTPSHSAQTGNFSLWDVYIPYHPTNRAS
jgi:hypothetical protein